METVESIFLVKTAPDLAEETYRRLLEMIQLGRIPTNVPLQERALSEALGVSRTPLREAFSRLLGGGFATRIGRGQMIIKEPTLREYLDILQLRLLLEGEAAFAAASRMPSHQADDVINELHAHLQGQNFSALENHRIDNLVHLTIAAWCGNSMHENMIFDLRIKARSFDHNSETPRFEPGCREHIALMECIRAGDAPGSRVAMEYHLNQARAGMLARLTTA